MNREFRSDGHCNLLNKLRYDVGSNIITELVGLCPNLILTNIVRRRSENERRYSLDVDDKAMEFPDYKKVIDVNQTQSSPIYFRGLIQQVYTTLVDKAALTSLYDQVHMCHNMKYIPVGYLKSK